MRLLSLAAPSMALALLAFAPSTSARAAVVFTDGTFNLANYSASPTFTSGPVTGSYSQCLACGDPSQALRFSLTLGNGSPRYSQGLANNEFLYNPGTQGAISSIAASVDRNTTTNLTGIFNVLFRPLIKQDGNYYVASIPGQPVTDPGSVGYQTISQSGLTAADFFLYDFSTGTLGTENPDFAGDPILLGLAQISSFTLAGLTSTGTYTADYDNLSFTLSTASTFVPEPASMALFGTGLVAPGPAYAPPQGHVARPGARLHA